MSRAKKNRAGIKSSLSGAFGKPADPADVLAGEPPPTKRAPEKPQEDAKPSDDPKPKPRRKSSGEAKGAAVVPALDVLAVGRVLGIDEKAVRARINRGSLESERMAGRRVVTRETLERLATSIEEQARALQAEAKAMRERLAEEKDLIG